MSPHLSARKMTYAPLFNRAALLARAAVEPLGDIDAQIAAHARAARQRAIAMEAAR